MVKMPPPQEEPTQVELPRESRYELLLRLADLEVGPRAVHGVVADSSGAPVRSIHCSKNAL